MRLPALPRPGARVVRRGGLGVLAGLVGGVVAGLLRAPRAPRR